jgi:DME family drug/metabolite transporter
MRIYSRVPMVSLPSKDTMIDNLRPGRKSLEPIDKGAPNRHSARMDPLEPRQGQPSLTQARVLIALAAILWSLSGGFTKILTRQSTFQLASVPVGGVAIAFYRVLFAGLVFLPLVRRGDVTFRPLMLVMGGSFAVMNLLFVTAMALGTSANAIFLQYTAPMWMYLAGIWLLGESADRRSSWALLIGLAGIGLIVAGGWRDARLGVVAIALGSGVAYAVVIVCLRIFRDVSSRYLTAFNHLFAALSLVPLLWLLAPPCPSLSQIMVLFLFGSVQMALPYWLMARGLRVVSASEAGTITLLEPLLNPLWAYLVAPEVEVPTLTTFAGGACILGALAWRYWPRP